MKMIESGHYTLSRDVENPNADRRKTRDVSAQPVWHKGMRVYVRVNNIDASTSFTRIEFLASRWPTLQAIGPGQQAAYEALAAALEPAAEDFDRLLFRLDCRNGTEYVLRRLHVTGKISLADIEAAHEAEMEDPKE